MSQPFRPFSEIPFAATLPALTDTVVGVVNKTTDVRFTLKQVQQVVGGGGGGGGGGSVTEVDTGTGLIGGPIKTAGTISLANTSVTPGMYTSANITVDQQGRLTAAVNGSNSGGLTVGSSTVSGGTNGKVLFDNGGILGELSVGAGADPLFLTQGFTLTATNPTPSGTPSFSYGGFFNVLYDTVIDTIGFTDQLALGINLQFNAGYNQFGGAGNVNGKYTPIALNVTGTYYGAGEKFAQAWGANMYSMGDSFLLSGVLTYAGGPIIGDEGQGFTPAFYCAQPNSVINDVITAVHRTTYSTTVTAPVAGSPVAQAIPVASTVGASIGDWVVLNQQVMAAGTRIWAMQIASINPGVSITGICAINLLIGDTVKPALCLSLANGGFGCGEGRVIVNNSGASYSTGTVNNVSGGAFIGSGTTWTNTMVGGDVLNVGSVWLAVDNLVSSPFDAGNPLRSVYQITTVNSNTSLSIFSFSVAGDTSYHGRGVPPATNLSYTVVPSARVMRYQPPGGGFTIICEYSAHTWTVGNTIECVFCPYPDVHGFDYRLGEWTAGGICREAIGFLNIGARMFDIGMSFGARGGIGSVADFDALGWGTAIAISSCQIGISISNTDNSVLNAIQIQSTADAGSFIVWQGSLSGLALGQNTTNQGTDFFMCTQGNPGLLRSIASAVNIDTLRAQLVWDGYFQLSGVHVASPYMRFGGSNTAAASIANTGDIQFASSNTFNMFINGSTGKPSLWQLLSIGEGGNSSGFGTAASIGVFADATANTTNQPSLALQLCAGVWNGAASQRQYAALQAVPGSGSDNAPISLQVQIWNNTYNNAADYNLPLEVFMSGLVKLGFDDVAGGSDKRVSLDAIANVSAVRTVTFPDVSGGLGVVVAGSHTPSSSSATGTAGTIEFDGTYLYVCVGTNTWVRSALTGGW